MNLSIRQLFGGAITLPLPSDVIDASDLRQIPDTQEVFLSPSSSTSYIFEILERVLLPDSSDDEVVRFHFDSLAHDNDATSSEVLTTTLPTTSTSTSTEALSPPILLTGIQHAPKFNSEATSRIKVLLAVWRLRQHNMDLVLSVNIPEVEQEDDAGMVWKEASAAMEVKDWGLFKTIED